MEICDLDTGAPIATGEGEVVVTLLRADYLLVRFGTGDLSAWTTDPDGQARLLGVLGRVRQAVKVRGHVPPPAPGRGGARRHPRVDAWRLLIERIDHRDELSCEIVAPSGGDGLIEEVRGRIRDGLRFAAPVRPRRRDH